MASHDYWAKTEEEPLPSRAVGATHHPASMYTRRGSTAQRVVRVPEADPAEAWQTFAERQKQRRTRKRPEKYVNMVPRTLAQTGAPASNGQLYAAPRALPKGSSPIPARRGRRGNSLWRWLVALVTGAIVILVVTYALTGSAFRISSVSVTGTQNASIVSNAQHLGVQGKNIFLLDDADVVKRLAALPRVAHVAVSKSLPNRLTISIVERTPALLWQTRQGTFSIDNQGIVIAPMSETTGTDNLSTVIDETPIPAQGKQKGTQTQGATQSKGSSALQPGMHLNATDVSFAVSTAKQLPALAGVSAFKLHYDGTLYNSVGDASVDGSSSKGAYIVESPDGWKANLGNAANANSLENRLRELHGILEFVQKEQLAVDTIDLRYGLRPVFTLKK